MSDIVWIPEPTGDGRLTSEECDIIRDLGQAWNGLRKVVGRGASREADLRELAAHIHALQQAVMSQAAARAYPDTFRLLGETIQEIGT